MNNAVTEWHLHLPGFKMSLRLSERIKILEYQEMISEINSFGGKKNGKEKEKKEKPYNQK